MIKDDIERNLASLVGLPVCETGRAVDMATFGFGRLIERDGRRGREVVPEYRLHIQARWRIVRDGTLLVGYRDWRYPPRGSAVDDADFDPSDERRNRRDDLVDDWIAHGAHPHFVREIRGTTLGDLALTFDDGCVLETFADQATSDDGHDEYWRLLPPPLSGGEPHFVVTAHGISD